MLAVTANENAQPPHQATLFLPLINARRHLVACRLTAAVNLCTVNTLLARYCIDTFSAHESPQYRLLIIVCSCNIDNPLYSGNNVPANTTASGIPMDFHSATQVSVDGQTTKFLQTVPRACCWDAFICSALESCLRPASTNVTQTHPI